MNTKGFTLIELLVTVAIIGVLAAIAIPSYIGMQAKAARSEAYTNLQNLRLLEEQFFADRGCYYTGCPGATTTISGVASIQTFLPRFQPGNASAMVFNYSITFANSATTFAASAVGKAGTRVAGDTFTIDNNNNRNF